MAVVQTLCPSSARLAYQPKLRDSCLTPQQQADLKKDISDIGKYGYINREREREACGIVCVTYINERVVDRIETIYQNSDFAEWNRFLYAYYLLRNILCLKTIIDSTLQAAVLALRAAAIVEKDPTTKQEIQEVITVVTALDQALVNNLTNIANEACGTCSNITSAVNDVRCIILSSCSLISSRNETIYCVYLKTRCNICCKKNDLLI